MLEIKKVAILGAGTMGAGIASIVCLHDEVLLVDVVDEQLKKAVACIDKTLQKAREKGLITEEQVKLASSKLRVSSNFCELSSMDLIIEAVPEKMEIKKAVFEKISQKVGDDVIVASNTSGLSISEMAILLKNPSRVLGVHFFNPVPVMKLVEVIRGDLTSTDVFDTAYNWVSKIGKEAVEVREFPGFVVNRILIPMINEAAWTLYDKVASASDIDKAMKLGANHPIGPLSLADMIGIDVCLHIMENLAEKLPARDKYIPAPILRDLVSAGKLGRKSGEGFFNYLPPPNKL